MAVPPPLAPEFGHIVEGDVQLLGDEAPLVLDNARTAWRVESGTVDLFAVTEGSKGAPTGTREYLCSLRAGALMLGIDPARAKVKLHLIAVGWEDSRVQRIDLSRGPDTGLDRTVASQLARGLEPWLVGLSRGASENIARREQAQTWLMPQEEIKLSPGERVTSRRGVVWARLVSGRARFIDIENLQTEAPPTAAANRKIGEKPSVVPLTPDSWLQERGDLVLAGQTTIQLLQEPGWRRHLQAAQAMILRCLVYGLRNVAQRERTRLRKRDQQIEQDTNGTLIRFASLLNEKKAKPIDFEIDAPLYQACVLVGNVQGIEIKAPPGWAGRREVDKPLSMDDVAKASRIRTRRVALRGEWWRVDNGPLVAFRQSDHHPLALLPVAAHGYRLVDPVLGERRRVDETVAETLSPEAYSLFAPFPDREPSAWDLLRFGLERCRKDVTAVIMTGLAGGLLTMATPIATAMIFDAVIPGHERGQLYQIGLALMVAAFASFAFRITSDIALLRIEGRMAGTLQAAVLDRLLRLPRPFFARHSAGDLANRVMMVEQIRRALTGIVLASLISGLFSIFSFALLFFYVPAAALVATGLTIGLGLATVLAGWAQFRAIMEGEELTGNIYSLVLQLVTGLQKLRLAGAEERAFNKWGRLYGELRSRLVASRKVNNLFLMFSSGYEIVALAAVFGAVALARDADLSTGLFLAFVAAFTTFLNSANAMARAVIQVFTIAPLYYRAQPILEALPEVDDTKAPVGRLSGFIEVSRVVFRYGRDAPWVLNGVSLAIRKGHFVALVGSSGCGKSTLVKLLLGFERPETGGVYYDGRDLRHLDLTAVRRQIGVVLQNGRLMPGSIFENIKGATDVDVDAAWEAVRLAGLADDIEAMPMGMHTVLTEGTAALSGGQIQRLLIARALVGKPQILIFDEATSALDNRTQAVITENLERLSVTRVVIAHRLSTVMKADRIFVFGEGKIAEQGTYDELMKNNGAFATLARRQLI